MPFTLIAMVASSLFVAGFLISSYLGIDSIDRTDGEAAALSANAYVWHQSAVNYAVSHPGVIGTLNQSQLTLPSWYVPAASWTTVIGAGRTVATYSPSIGGILPSRIATEFGNQLDWYSGAGMVSGGYIRGVLAVPAGVPNGVVAIVTELSP